MPTLTDVFTPDGFTPYSLTAAIQRFPYQPTIIQQLGLFREVPIKTTTAVVEEMNGMITLVPTTKRGGPGVPSQDPKRVVRSFKIPHIQLDDIVTADDVIDVRQFGNPDPMAGVGEVISRKFEVMRRSLDVTDEYLRMGALNGIVTYPTNSEDAALNLFTEFGTSIQTVALGLGTETTDVAAMVATIRDAIQSAMGGTPYTGITCLCSRVLFRALIAHPLVRQFYADYTKQRMLGSIGYVEVNQRDFVFEGVRFIEYGDHTVSDKTLYGGDATGGGTAFPTGADIFQTWLAPGDFVEATGTLGQPQYARQYMSPDGKSVNLEAQRNPLNICTRPRALVTIDYDT